MSSEAKDMLFHDVDDKAEMVRKFGSDDIAERFHSSFVNRERPLYDPICSECSEPFGRHREGSLIPQVYGVRCP